MFARMNPDKKIIYLVYNKRAKDEAKGTFPRNVDVHTIHSLAYKKEGWKWKPEDGDFLNLTPAVMLKFFSASGDCQTLAHLACSYLVFFLNSKHINVDDQHTAAQFLVASERQLPGKTKELFIRYIRDMRYGTNSCKITQFKN